MQAGFSQAPILPEGEVSLAGYGKDMPRHYTHVLDAPQARAVALSSDETAVVLVAADFLTPTDRLSVATRLHALPKLPHGVPIVLHGQHTHSGPGNYWNNPIAQRVAGPFRPSHFDFLARRFARVAAQAWEARQPARVGFAQDTLSGLQENRRRADGPIDETISVFAFRTPRGKPLGAMVNFAGHPVIVAEGDFHALSADFPGRVSAMIEEEYPVCLYLNGAVGGLSIWFPDDPIPVEEHLKKVSEPIARRAEELLGQCSSKKEPIAFSRQKVSLPHFAPEPLPPNYIWWDFLLAPLVATWTRLARSGYGEPRETVVSALRLGGAALVFHPSDFGVGAGLGTRAAGKACGLAAVPVGHSDDWAGYIHPISEMLIKPVKKEGMDYRYMTIYENLMGIHGRGAYEHFRQAEKKALAEVAG